MNEFMRIAEKTLSEWEEPLTHKDVQKFLRSIPAPGPEWQSIDTAPKDGSAILAFWSGDAERHGANFGITRFSLGDWCDVDDDEVTFRDPTHWMRLPNAPVTRPDGLTAAMDRRQAK